MDPFYVTVNAFIEDTCVIVVIAYVLARGPVLDLLFRARLSRRALLYLGAILGLIGLSETIFPGARYPYVTSTLIVTFAAVNSGLAAGLVSAAVVTAGSALLQTPAGLATTAATVFAAALIAAATRRMFRASRHPLVGLIGGVAAQAGAILIRHALAGAFTASAPWKVLIFGVPANGFGVMLLLIVLRDARVRAMSQRHREEAERAHALVAEAQLAALRARVHPHFLYNSLTSIAALCGIDAARAEQATIRLSQLMRRSLEARHDAPIPLREELEAVRAYLDMEQYRFGERLCVEWRVDPACLEAAVPGFCVQTLAENAVIHGLADRMESGRLWIDVHHRAGRVVVAVKDNGVGMLRAAGQSAVGHNSRDHGLQIVTQQLELLYGAGARVRLFSALDRGTLAAFAIPTNGLAMARSRGMVEYARAHSR